MKTRIKLPLFMTLIIFLFAFSCEKEKDDPITDDNNTPKELTNTEKGILGTWYYYSQSYSEYRCITFNSDRTACYFEIKTLSSSATKDNKKCYTDWYVDGNVEEGNVYDVYIKGDYTGGKFWAGYTINTSDWILRKDGSTSMQETSKMECSFCN